MSVIKISDQAVEQELDRRAMAAVRGGFANTKVVNNLNLGIDVKNVLFMPINVLNQSRVGAPVSAELDIEPSLESNINL